MIIEIKKIPQNINISVVKKGHLNYIFIFGWLGFIKYKIKMGISLKYRFLKLYGSDQFFFLYKKLINNFYSWVTIKSKKILKLEGVGFKYRFLKKNLFLVLGYSHILKVNLCNNIKIRLIKNKTLIIYTIDLFLMNRYIYLLKSLKSLNIYKGKGIILNTEKIIKKEGKKSSF